MRSIPAEYHHDTIRILLVVYTAFASIVHASLINKNTTYFQTRQLSGQQYGLDYNLQNYANSGKSTSKPRTLFDWDSSTVAEEQTHVQNTKKINQNLETDERVVNNVWWPWKNYDDWLNGRGLKVDHPKKKGKKPRKEKKDRKKNRKNEGKRKKQKTDKSKIAIGDKNRSPVINTKEGNENARKNNLLRVNSTFENNVVTKKNNQLSINAAYEDNEIIKKESIPGIQYRASPIDIILRNLSLVPTLMKYSSRNYTYDVNECLTNNGGCEGLCINTPGSYRCHCPPGFMVADTKCEDIDECLLRNGHGPCQGSCANTWGGYKCSCHGIPGTKLAGDGHTCDDVDECRDGSAGCSHHCINTTGSAFCVCPDGMQLDDDWKTCVDVDECSDAELHQCESGASCLNTYGSYKCA